MSTFWGFGYKILNGNGDEVEMGKKYFNFRAAFVHNLRGKNKSSIGHNLELSAEINNYLILGDGVTKYRPNIGVRFVMGFTELY